MKANMKHVGYHSYRLLPGCDNPREAAFAEQWQKENDQGQVLAYLLGDGQKKGFVDEGAAKVAATVIQWLGSNVGMSFIQESAKRSPELRKYLKGMFK